MRKLSTAWCVAMFVAAVPVMAQTPLTPTSRPYDDALAGDSAAIQKRLDEVALQGGTVDLRVGRFRLDRPIIVPEGVCLQGTWQGPHHAQLTKGTIFLVYADAGREDGPPLITLSPSSTVKGITFFYPEQRIPGTKAYPWTIQGRGMHNSVIDCTFVNAYQAMDFATHANELHYVVRREEGCWSLAGESPAREIVIAPGSSRDSRAGNQTAEALDGKGC